MIVRKTLGQVQSEKISWLIHPYFARGKLTILDGDPDLGKSLMMMDIAARVSRGGPFLETDSIGPPGNILLIGAEDAAADTLRPRAEAAGADLDRISFAPADGTPLPRLPEDLEALEALIREESIVLVVIDPLMAVLSSEVAANSDQSIRPVLTALAQIAERTGAAIVLIRHLTKKIDMKAIYRGLDSIGIFGTARVDLLLAQHPENENWRVLCSLKKNVTGRIPSVVFEICQNEAGQPRIEWLGHENRTANELCMQTPRALRPKDRVSAWLKDLLAKGPRRSKEILSAAAEAGIPEKTLRRAKAEAMIEAHEAWDYARNCGEWWWYDPESDWPKDALFKRPRGLPPFSPL